MNYKSVYRKNKKLINELFSMMFWLLLLLFVINISDRAQPENSELDKKARKNTSYSGHNRVVQATTLAKPILNNSL
jgi:hypothetical protein